MERKLLVNLATAYAVTLLGACAALYFAVASEFMRAGSHSVVWDASGLSAGVYFYTVKTGDFSKTLKMTLLK